MVDVELFAAGCGISFIALCGAYAYLRERFMAHTEKRHEPVRGRRRDAVGGDPALS